MKLVKILLCLFFLIPAARAEETTPHHAIALHGDPKYMADFKNVDYVKPDAPKGGILKSAAIGSFDSLNPFIIKGTPAAGLNYLRSDIFYESLMQNAWDEPFTLYGIIAESVEIPEDRSWVAFNLRPQAKFHDGQPITADDVVWTFNTLMEKGQPFFKAYWGDVKSVTAESPSRVKFEFAVKGNAELPLIIAEMVVLPKHFWEGKNFDESSLEMPVGSGPYKIGKVDAGRSIEFVRDPNWWGKELSFFKGMYNFDTLVYDYYRDADVAHEAFFAGEYDVKLENSAKLWKQGYNVGPVKEGRIAKEEIANERPAGMQAFIYNIRRPVFADIKVREALNYAFDFEWSNKQFAFGSYTRTDSYFENSKLASAGLPMGDELLLLEKYRGKIPDAVFETTYINPKTDGSGNNRENLRKAARMLEDAGYILGADGIRTNKDGLRLEFEILDSNTQFERWVMPFIQNLQRIGVKATFRVVDTAQYQNRLNSFDFDMTISTYGQSESPGNEQRDFWGSDKADIEGSRNYIGVKDPIIDEIVTDIIHAGSREDLVAKVRALDRILLYNHYVIPMWHYPKWRIAYWKKLERPQKLSPIAPLVTETWWQQP
jgi:microcin C transport system substrate-binding protein